MGTRELARSCVWVCKNETSRPIQDRFVRVGQIARGGRKGEETRTRWISMGLPEAVAKSSTGLSGPAG